MVFPHDTLWVWPSSQTAYNLFKMVSIPWSKSYKFVRFGLIWSYMLCCKLVR